jgi:hypothetical protein
MQIASRATMSNMLARLCSSQSIPPQVIDWASDEPGEFASP